MKPSEVKSLLQDALHAQWSYEDGKLDEPIPPVFLQGPPGVGKSDVVRDLAAEMKIGFVDTRAAQMDPTDARGIPAVINGKAEFLQSAEFPTEGRGIWILDELSSAPPLVQAAFYQLVLDGKLGQYDKPKGWYIVAAGNRMKDRAVVAKMSSALANRFTWIDFEPNLDDWIAWAIAKSINPNVVGFIGWRGGELLAPDFDPKADEKAYPTPRTWAMVSKWINTIQNRNILHRTLEGAVGRGATAEFMAFLKVQTEIPDIDGILNGTNHWTPKDERIDLRYAVVSALAGRAKPKHYENVLKYADKLPAEFNVMLIQQVAMRDQAGMMACPSFGKWARAHSDIIVSRKAS